MKKKRPLLVLFGVEAFRKKQDSESECYKPIAHIFESV